MLIRGKSSPKANPFAVATPILRPVKDPGPALTPTASSCLNERFKDEDGFTYGFTYERRSNTTVISGNPIKMADTKVLILMVRHGQRIDETADGQKWSVRFCSASNVDTTI